MPGRRVGVGDGASNHEFWAAACGTRLADHAGVLIRRCAWHRKYHGIGRLIGVSSWRGWRIAFSDGLCADCAMRARSEWRLSAGLPAPVIAPPVRRSLRSLRPDFALTAAVVMLAVTVTFGLVMGPPAPDRTATAPEPVAAPIAVASRPSEPPASAPRPETPAVATRAEPAAVATPRSSPGTRASSERASSMEFAPPDRPVRVVTRARGGTSRVRPATASYRPVVVATPVAFTDTSPLRETAPAPPMMPLAAARESEVQAP